MTNQSSRSPSENPEQAAESLIPQCSSKSRARDTILTIWFANVNTWSGMLLMLDLFAELRVWPSLLGFAEHRQKNTE